MIKLKLSTTTDENKMEKNENEMEYGMKMKWSTGRKLNGLQDKNEMEHWIKWNEVHN